MKPNLTRSFLLAAALLIPATASADPAETIRGYAAQSDALKSDLRIMDNDMTVAACQQASTAAGAPSDARAVCTEYKKWRLLGEAHAIITAAQMEIARLKYIEEDLASSHTELGAVLITAAKKCTDGLERVRKDGVQTDYKLKVSAMGTSVETTVAAARTGICDVLAAKAKTFSAKVADAKVTQKEAITRPYKDAGITGDRLEYLVHYQGYQWYGVGQVALNTPAAMKKAKVMFNVTEDRDRVVTVRRFEFKGDKLVKETSKQYLLQPGPKAYR